MLPVYLIGAIALVALVVWLLRRPSRQAEPEDDVAAPIDREELEAAERDLADEDGEPLSAESDDDWGPGTR